MAEMVWFEAPTNYMLRNKSGMVGTWMDRKGRRLVHLAKGQVGVDTGDLRQSIGHRTSEESYGIRVRVSAKDKKAMMHHEGTRPHAIHAKNAKALRFMHKGKLRYAQRVYHPGTKPNKFLTDNLRKVL